MFNAADEEQWPIISRHIDESDYYVVVVAHRYGSTIGDLSFTVFLLHGDGAGHALKWELSVAKGAPGSCSERGLQEQLRPRLASAHHSRSASRSFRGTLNETA
jgi:hypothetical protein